MPDLAAPSPASLVVDLPPIHGAAIASFVPSFLAQYTTERSRDSAFGNLKRLARLIGTDDPYIVPWHLLRAPHTAAIRARLLEAGFSRRTVNATLSALRVVLRHAWRAGLAPLEEIERAADLRPVKGADLPRGRHIPSAELKALVDVARTERDVAMLGLLRSGMRRAEVVGLDLADYDGTHVRYTAKGHKKRELPLAPGIVAALDAWIDVRGKEPGALLQAVASNGRPLGRRMSMMALWMRLVELGKRAGIRAVSPHDFRRTTISDLLEQGVDITTVSKIAGHSDVNMTSRYDRRPAAAQQRAVEGLFMPVKHFDREKK